MHSEWPVRLSISRPGKQWSSNVINLCPTIPVPPRIPTLNLSLILLLPFSLCYLIILILIMYTDYYVTIPSTFNYLSKRHILPIVFLWRTFVFLLLYGYYHTYLLIATLFAQKLNYFLIILQSVNYIAIYIYYYRFL